MTSLGVVKLPGAGHLQLFVGGVTLWQTGSDPGAWTPASLFLPTQGAADIFEAIAACEQANGAPQVWGTAALHGNVLYTRYKASPAPGADWVAAEPFSSPHPIVPGYQANALAGGLSATNEIQLFATMPDPWPVTKLVTCWQTEPDRQDFTNWEEMAGAPPLGSSNQSIAVYNLPDRRLQLWACTPEGELLTSWKETTHPGSPWTPWAQASSPSRSAFATAGAVRADGRVQLWCLGGEDKPLVTSIQPTAPSATITAWEAFPLPTGTAFVFNVAVGKLSDGRLQLFIIGAPLHGDDAYTYTTWQTSIDPDSPWSAWQQLNTTT